MAAILSDTAIKKAKPKEKRYRMSDTQGLFLEVAPNGSKWWRLRYFKNGKETMISLGTYPEISLKLARERRDQARAFLAEGKDPHDVMAKADRPQEEITPVFSSVARQWLEFKSKNWVEGHAKRIGLRVERCCRAIPDKPFRELELDDFLPFLKKFDEDEKYESAKRYAQLCSQICRYAKILKLIQRNPLEDVSQLLVQPKPRHMSAILEPERIGHLLLDIDSYTGYSCIGLALRILPYVFTRSSELRGAKWSEIDMENALWIIPAERMKMRRPHYVPLARQVMELLAELKRQGRGAELCFPSPMSRSRPISDVGLLNALRRLGYSKEEMCIHGFRSIASTRLNEMGFRPDLIEAQLAHEDKNALRAAYNRSTYLDERRDMMQKWADYLDSLRETARGKLGDSK